MFQGGFVGEDAKLLVTTVDNSTFHAVAPSNCNFIDGNCMQRLDISCDNVTQFRLLFERSSDFYGRVVIYHFNVLGEEVK
jgi:hypothetical protein